MSVTEILSLTLAVISSIIALISLAIVFWDHFYDDKILSRQVRNYYENIESVIFAFYKTYSLRASIMKENAELADQHFELIKQWAYFMGNFKRRFDEFSKYFGLTLYGGNHVITQNSPYCVEFEGQMHEIVQDIPRINYSHKNMFKLDSTGIHDLEGNIYKIDDYLKALRDYWNTYYSKRLFRKKLKPKINFKLLC